MKEIIKKTGTAADLISLKLFSKKLERVSDSPP